ncbi:MAG: VWA domain-containing protein [bacterium]|nr:VWA domain-containing protein [bacterium]
MRKIIFCLLVSLLLTVSMALPLESAQQNPRIMLVLDASGSMWGQIKGETKIEIARKVIADFLKKLDPNMEIGLVVYGHRSKGDCKDIETLIPIGKSTASKIIAIVNKINPKGKTPLSHAVLHAAKELRFTEERATVVLVSDGVETCNADPCSIGKELAMGGVDFTAHVIGFDVKGEDQVGLRCLAANTGGLFLPAADAGELSAAFSKVVEKAKEAPKPVIEDPGKASLKGPATVAAGSVFKVGWEGPDSRSDYITIVEKDAPDRNYRNYAYTSTGNPVTITATEKPGKYELRYVFNHTRKVLARADITVTPVTATVEGPAKVGAGSPFEVKWTGPNNRADYITIVPEGADHRKYLSYSYTKHGSPGKITAPDTPGAYEIRYVTSQTRTILAQTKITVLQAEATLKAPESIAAGSPLKIEWTGPNNKSDFITIVPPDAEDRKHLSYGYTKHGSPAKITAPDKAGEYQVRYVTGSSNKVLARAKIMVTAAAGSLDFPSSAPAGSIIKVNWTGPDNKSDYITIVPPDAEARKHLSYGYTKHGSPAKITAPDEAGEYEVRYITGQSKKILVKSKITVTAVTATLDFPSPVPAGSEIKVTWTGPNNKRDYITIVEKDAPAKEYGNYSYTSKGSPATISALDKAGEYEIRYIMSQSRTVLARGTITLTPVTAKVSAPAAVKANEKFTVTWQGPNYKRDFVTIAEAGTPDKKYLNYAYTKKGSPGTLRAPKKPGKYEVRYVLGQSKTVLARTAITVE